MKWIKDKIEEEGCVVIPDFFSEEELAKIFPAVEMVHNNWLEKNREEYLKYKMINSNNLTSTAYSKERLDLFNFIASDKMAALIRTLIGDKAFFLGSQVFFNPKDHSKDGYWHRDTQYTGIPVEEQKKAILAEPVFHFHIPFIDDDNFELVPGSHKRWDTELEFDVRMNSNNSPLENAKSYDCKRGGIRIFSAHSIHRGKNYGPSPERFVFDPLFAHETEKSKSYINMKAMPDDELLDKLKNREFFELG